ncbi:hypothetical protein RZO55_21760 [Clostridium boliviensis]|uniref:Uncharacterized protein n=1 Tax=Clostridium boliviensis TaxID=318465 RepID=A0ABU4GRE3_9CLOT|nr:hypothetical protein [Clostridium boliviensis]MDW2800200.1 hypothetical protein [Clostridium boliviensis]
MKIINFLVEQAMLFTREVLAMILVGVITPWITSRLKKRSQKENPPSS